MSNCSRSCSARLSSFSGTGPTPSAALRPDRCTTRADAADDKVAIGGSGFGVMAIIVAVERGWVTREAALERLRRMLDLLTARPAITAHSHISSTAARRPPFRSGARTMAATSSRPPSCAWGFCARGSISTATRRAEQALRGRITWLWEEVEWDWYTQGGRSVLYWHWSPNNGWAMDHEIRGWNECLITYVLAAGAPRYPIDPIVYHRGFRLGHGISSTASATTISSCRWGCRYGGPLFFTHYSFCGLDPRGLQGRYADYWELNQHHVRINHAHCVANPSKFKGYGP